MARHASLADQLTALMAYRNRPDGVEEGIDLTIGESTVDTTAKTNWRVSPVETNPEDLAGLRVERRAEIRPSMQRVEQETNGIEVDKHGRPRGAGVERDKEGRVIRIGKLKFSDGTQTEKAYKRGIDGDIVQFDAVLPVGAMLDTVDTQTTISGVGDASEPIGHSNRYFADMFGVKKYGRVSGSGKRRGKGPTREEAKAALEEAWANTVPGSYTFTKCPDGLPSASGRIADSFLSMSKNTCSGGGAVAWEDLASAAIRREIWEKSIRDLDEKDRKAVETAMSAKTLADVGLALGQSGEYARRKGGMRALLTANDNLASALRKAAA